MDATKVVKKKPLQNVYFSIRINKNYQFNFILAFYYQINRIFKILKNLPIYINHKYLYLENCFLPIIYSLYYHHKEFMFKFINRNSNLSTYLIVTINLCFRFYQTLIFFKLKYFSFWYRCVYWYGSWTYSCWPLLCYSL